MNDGAHCFNSDSHNMSLNRSTSLGTACSTDSTGSTGSTGSTSNMCSCVESITIMQDKYDAIDSKNALLESDMRAEREQLIFLQHENDRLWNIVNRMQVENSKLKHENKKLHGVTKYYMNKIVALV